MDHEINRILNEILKWERFQGISKMRELIPQVLDDEKKKYVYEMTDGTNSQALISKKIGVASGTISNWWNLWFSYGILSKDGTRYSKIMSLKELGFDINKS